MSMNLPYDRNYREIRNRRVREYAKRVKNLITELREAKRELIYEKDGLDWGGFGVECAMYDYVLEAAEEAGIDMDERDGFCYFEDALDEMIEAAKSCFDDVADVLEADNKARDAGEWDEEEEGDEEEDEEEEGAGAEEEEDVLAVV